MKQRFAGKIAIVTGAGQGIGKGIASRLAEEGATVVVADYNEATATSTAAEIAQQSGNPTLARPVNISAVSAVQQLVADVVARFGRIDILVNNAGVTQTKPFLDLTEADWDRVMEINQRGMFFCLQAVAAQMVAQIPEEVRAASGPADVVTVKANSAVSAPTPQASYGKIVNMSSISGRRGRPLSAHYAASKAATISITQSAALALAPYNINVNAVSPSVVPTSMWEQIDAERGKLFGAAPGEAIRAFINTIPLKRAATPADIAGAVAFLCSADADYITGQTLNVDGGYEMD
ncbi:MAG: glucose 1-dehydrogenase [Caldilineaceae bacterium]